MDHFPKFWFKHVDVSDSTGCWNWIGWIGRNPRYPKHAYGFYKYFDESGKRRSTSAHRYAYMCVHGQIAKNLDIDHICHNKLCVNPDHLQAITHKENMARRLSRGKMNPVTVKYSREARANGCSVKSLAEMFSISVSAMQRAIARNTWEEVA